MTVKIRIKDGKYRLEIDHKGRRLVRTIGPVSEENLAEAERRKVEYETGLRVLGVAAIARPQPPEAKTPVPTVKEYADRWLKELTYSGLKVSTIQSYTSNLNIHILPRLGPFGLDEIKYDTVKRLLQAKLESGYTPERGKHTPRTRRAYSKDTVRLIRASLRAMLEEAVTEGLIPSNPAAHRKLTRIYAHSRQRKSRVGAEQVYTMSERLALEATFAAKAPAYHELVMVLARAGMRVGEALALEWADVDFAACKLRVNKSASYYRPVSTPKTANSIRLVDMSEGLAAALVSLRRRKSEAALAKGEELGAIVFAQENGRRLNYRRFLKCWDRMHRLSGMRRRTPHDLRHTFASQLLANRETVTYVAAQMGDNPATVMGTYAHFIPGEKAERGVDRLDKEGKR